MSTSVIDLYAAIRFAGVIDQPNQSIVQNKTIQSYLRGVAAVTEQSLFNNADNDSLARSELLQSKHSDAAAWAASQFHAVVPIMVSFSYVCRLTNAETGLARFSWLRWVL